jgi:hypothetical protein
LSIVNQHWRISIAIVAAALMIWTQQRLSDMDRWFFQPSISGIKGVFLYLANDYTGAADAYRQHFQRRLQEGWSSGDPALDALLEGNLTKADAISRHALVNKPQDVTALLTLGEIALAQHNIPIAVSFTTFFKKTQMPLMLTSFCPLPIHVLALRQEPSLP